MKKRKILLISFDGGTWKILDLAIQAGVMPFLQGLIKRGSRGTLLSSRPPLTPAAWASFQTGTGPGGHGVVDFSFWDPKNQELRLVDSCFLKHTLWDKAGQKGKRLGVINVPLTYPPRPLNGYLITGFLTPDINSPFTYPSDFKGRLLKAIPDYQILTLRKAKEYQAHRQFNQFLAKMAAMVSLRTKAAKFLLTQAKIDLLMIHFQAVDIIQHPLWPYLDPENENFDSQKQKKIFQAFYQLLDQSCRELEAIFRQQAGGPVLVLFISDHGFQAHKKRLMVGNLFFQRGLIDRRGRTKARINRLLSRFGLSFRLEDKSQLTVLGRSGWGIVYLDPQFKRQKAELERKLRELLLGVEEPKTGERVIKRIWRREELYSGRRLELLPDFLIEPEDGYSLTAGVEPKIGLFQEVKSGVDFHLGIHHEEGIVACSEKGSLPKKIEQVGEWVLEKL